MSDFFLVCLCYRVVVLFPWFSFSLFWKRGRGRNLCFISNSYLIYLSCVRLVELLFFDEQNVPVFFLSFLRVNSLPMDG